MYKVGKPAPELKDVPLAADANQFGVDAVTATFTLESDRVAEQIADDAHPKAAPKTAKAPVHHAARQVAVSGASSVRMRSSLQALLNYLA